MHYIFAQPTGEPIGCSRGDLPPGIDIKGAGGFVLAPGSMKLDGRQYRHIPGTPKLSEALASGTLRPPPDWLIKIIRPPRPEWKPSARQYPRTGEAEYLEAALRYVPADDRETWLKVGGALHDTGETWARSLWDQWAASCAQKFSPRAQEEAWRSFSRHTSRRVGVGTIIVLARGHGFAGRKSGEAR